MILKLTVQVVVSAIQPMVKIIYVSMILVTILQVFIITIGGLMLDMKTLHFMTSVLKVGIYQRKVIPKSLWTIRVQIGIRFMLVFTVAVP